MTTQHVHALHLRRLPLQGTRNTRDLGGYPCPGGATRWGRFYRSDNLAALTPGDIELLQRLGVATAVDLRREDEARRAPSALLGAPGCTVHAVSLQADLLDVDFEGELPGSMAGLYTALLDHNGAEIATVLRAMAAAEGGVIFHCAVGKDRTGVIAMLLLKLAGVGDADVIADYAVTDIYMNEIFDAQAEVFRMGEIPDYILRSRPASMEYTLAHLQASYGGAEAYLAGVGLERAHIETLKQRLVEKG